MTQTFFNGGSAKAIYLSVGWLKVAMKTCRVQKKMKGQVR